MRRDDDLFLLTVPRDLLASWEPLKPNGWGWTAWLSLQLSRTSSAIRCFARTGGEFALGRTEGLIRLGGELDLTGFRRAEWSPAWVTFSDLLSEGVLVLDGACRRAAKSIVRVRDRRQAILFVVWLAIELNRIALKRFKKWAELGVIGRDGIFRSADFWAWRRTPGHEAPPLFPASMDVRKQIREWLTLVAGRAPRAIPDRCRPEGWWPPLREGAWFVDFPDRPLVPLRPLMFHAVKYSVGALNVGPDGGVDGFDLLHADGMHLPSPPGEHFGMRGLLQDPASVEPVGERLRRASRWVIVCADVVDFADAELSGGWPPYRGGDSGMEEN